MLLSFCVVFLLHGTRRKCSSHIELMALMSMSMYSLE